MTQISLSATYAPAEAERGKFAKIDGDWLTNLGYPASSIDAGPSKGRFAVLTYQVNPPEISLSAASVTIASTISAYIVNWMTEFTTTVTNVVTTQQLQADTTYVASTGLIQNTTYVVDCPAGKPFYFIEVRNMSNDTVYYLPSSEEIPFATLSAVGLPIGVQGFYSATRTIDKFSLGTAATGVDVRVFGHYKS